MKRNIRKLWSKKICLILLVLSPSLALADTGNVNIQTVLQGLVSYLQSGPARVLFVLSLVGVGYGTLVAGKIPKERAVAIVIGIGIVFGASYLAQQFGLGS